MDKKLQERLDAAEQDYLLQNMPPPKPGDAVSRYEDIVRHKADDMFDIETDRAQRLYDVQVGFQQELSLLMAWCRDWGLVDESGKYPWERSYSGGKKEGYSKEQIEAAKHNDSIAFLKSRENNDGVDE